MTLDEMVDLPGFRQLKLYFYEPGAPGKIEKRFQVTADPLFDSGAAYGLLQGEGISVQHALDDWEDKVNRLGMDAKANAKVYRDRQPPFFRGSPSRG